MAQQARERGQDLGIALRRVTGLERIVMDACNLAHVARPLEIRANPDWVQIGGPAAIDTL
jgi:hypothetical protein